MSGRRLRIHGRVQGVFFRNWTADRALALIVETWDGRARSLRVGYWRSVQLIEGCS